MIASKIQQHPNTLPCLVISSPFCFVRQKLFPEALQKLGVRQAQVRYIPMHLHAKALVLPEWRGQSNVFIRASVPRHFLTNLRTLKIKIPPK